MQQIARVTRIFTKGYVELALQGKNRFCDADCATCPQQKAACMVLTPEDERVIGESEVKVALGDLVQVEPAVPYRERFTWMAYGMPAVMFLLGFFLGKANGQGTSDQILTGAIFALLTFGMAWIMNRRARMRKHMRVRVVRVCRSAD